MMKLAILVAAMGVATAASLSNAKAETRSVSCQSVNGQTVCLSTSRGTGISLSCQTTDGNTTCLGSGGLRCEAHDGGRLMCRGGDSSTQVEIYGPETRTQGTDEDENEDEDRFLP
jgi:hypothetical protein